MIAVVNYGAGNIRSVMNAFTYCGGDMCLASDADTLRAADALVLPGVGAFGFAMEQLRASGLEDVLTQRVLKDGVPILGLCLGIQLMMEQSEETPGVPGLGWLDGTCVRLTPDDSALSVPHMGWNTVQSGSDARVFDGISDGKFYFVHEYVAQPKDPSVESGWVDYGGQWTVALQRDNIHAVQFHPEKSQEDGLALIRNFIGMARK